MKVLKSIEAVIVLAASVIVTVIHSLVSLVATATVMPVAKAWHAGRLSAEHAVQNQLAMANLMAKLAPQDDAKSDSTGAYL